MLFVVFILTLNIKILIIYIDVTIIVTYSLFIKSTHRSAKCQVNYGLVNGDKYIMKIAIYNKFKDYNDFKSGAEFFKKGSIVPARIAKFSHKRDTFSSRMTFTHDSHMRIVNDVMFIIPSEFQYKNGTKSAISIKKSMTATVKCAPYCKYLMLVGWGGYSNPIKTINNLIK